MYTNYYMVLGVAPEASEAEIHAAYKALARTMHPDTVEANGDRRQWDVLNEAYTVLRTARARYDAERYLMNRHCTACQGKGRVQQSLSFTRSERVLCPVCHGTGDR